jgi:hypothetical protein
VRRSLLLLSIVLSVVVGLFLSAMGVAGAIRGSDGRVNGTGPVSGAGADGEPVTCEVQDQNGDEVTIVSASDYGDFSYWLRYGSGGDATRVEFNVRPQFPDSPLAGQTQVFVNTGIDNIRTPFGVPFWGGDLTSGPWVLRVSNNLGESAACRFRVVP